VSARLDACRGSSRLYFSHFAACTVDDTVELYAAKPDTRPESRFLPTPPVMGVPVGISPSRLAPKKTRMLPDGEKISKISLFVLTQLTNVTDTQTPHVDIGHAYASHRAAKTTLKLKSQKSRFLDF